MSLVGVSVVISKSVFLLIVTVIGQHSFKVAGIVDPDEFGNGRFDCFLFVQLITSRKAGAMQPMDF